LNKCSTFRLESLLNLLYQPDCIVGTGLALSAAAESDENAFIGHSIPATTRRNRHLRAPNRDFFRQPAMFPGNTPPCPTTSPVSRTRFCLLLSSQHFSGNSRLATGNPFYLSLCTLYSVMAITLNRRRHPHPHGNPLELPCKTACFASFFTAHLAGFRHENRFSATKSACVSLIAAGSAYPCHHRHCRQRNNRRHACRASLPICRRQQNRTTRPTTSFFVFHSELGTRNFL
jgi:hypothetical protein